MDNSQHSAQFKRILDLSFQTLSLKSNGYSEVKDVLRMIQQLLQVETIGIFIWDNELNTLYPLGTCGNEHNLLSRHINENESSIWVNCAQNISHLVFNCINKINY